MNYELQKGNNKLFAFINSQGRDKGIRFNFGRISLQICIAIFSGRERPLAGTMVALACTYLTYALMPIRLKDAVLAGTILAITDVILLVTVGQFDIWSHQVSWIDIIKKTKLCSRRRQITDMQLIASGKSGSNSHIVFREIRRWQMEKTNKILYTIYRH